MPRRFLFLSVFNLQSLQQLIFYCSKPLAPSQLLLASRLLISFIIKTKAFYLPSDYFFLQIFHSYPNGRWHYTPVGCVVVLKEPSKKGQSWWGGWPCPWDLGHDKLPSPDLKISIMPATASGLFPVCPWHPATAWHTEYSINKWMNGLVF